APVSAPSRPSCAYAARPRSWATFTPPLRPASATVIPPFFSSAISLPPVVGRNPPPVPLRLLQFSRSASEDALLALLDELADLLAALASDLLVERGTVLVADGLTALSPPELTTLAAD